MDVRDQRKSRLGADSFKGLSRLHTGHRDPDKVSTGGFDRLNLRDRGLNVTGFGIGHALHCDRRVTADRYVAYMNLSAFAALNWRRLVHGHYPPVRGQ